MAIAMTEARDGHTEARTTVRQAPTAVDKLVAAFVRVRGVDRLEGGIMTRYWLAHDMGVSAQELDGVLGLLRWSGLVELPNANLVLVADADAMREIALSAPPESTNVVWLCNTPRKKRSWRERETAAKENLEQLQVGAV
jgi:hypothetical protein